MCFRIFIFLFTFLLIISYRNLQESLGYRLGTVNDFHWGFKPVLKVTWKRQYHSYAWSYLLSLLMIFVVGVVKGVVTIGASSVKVSIVPSSPPSPSQMRLVSVLRVLDVFPTFCWVLTPTSVSVWALLPAEARLTRTHYLPNCGTQFQLNSSKCSSLALYSSSVWIFILAIITVAAIKHVKKRRLSTVMIHVIIYVLLCNVVIDIPTNEELILFT